MPAEAATVAILESKMAALFRATEVLESEMRTETLSIDFLETKTRTFAGVLGKTAASGEGAKTRRVRNLRQSRRLEIVSRSKRQFQVSVLLVITTSGLPRWATQVDR